MLDEAFESVALTRIAYTLPDGTKGEDEAYKVVARAHIATSCDPSHPQFGQNNRAAMDRLYGKVKETVDVTVSTPPKMVMSETGASLMAVTSMRGRVMNEHGEVEEVEINLGRDD